MNLDQIQQIAAKPSVALGGSGSAGGYMWLADVASVMQAVGIIASGTLSVLLLGNYIYMKWLKKK